MSPESKWHGVAWGLLALAALVAPWLLGGRAEVAPWVLGGLLWTVVPLVLLGVQADYRTWRVSAEYERRRGQATANPWKVFGRGLIRLLPLWLFLAILGMSLLNPAYRWEGEALVRQASIDWLPLVIDPARSGPGIFLLAGLLTALGLLANPASGLERRLRHWLLAGLLVNAMVLCWTGLIFKLLGADLMLGKFEPRAGYFFATFYYKNHWAAYAILYCGVAACFFFRDLRRWFTHARRAGTGGLALLALFFLGLTLPLAETRSGILLFGIFGLVIGVGLYRKLFQRTLFSRLAILAAGLVVPLGFFYLSFDDLLHNWERTEGQIAQGDSLVFDAVRARHAPEVCLDMLGDRPAWGWGYLSYDPLFPVYATAFFRDADGQLTVDMEFAHNDWLQGLAEFGLAGSALAVLGVLGIGRMARGTRAFRGRVWIFLALGLLGIFALWDFPFSNPAVLVNAAVLFLLARKGANPLLARVVNGDD
ncbi:MAG: O-antigen ligase family protein [Puniceicoccaceae bacterium]